MDIFLKSKRMHETDKYQENKEWARAAAESAEGLCVSERMFDPLKISHYLINEFII